MTNLKTIIKAVEENNETNGCEWSKWDDSFHIMDAYCKDGYDDSEISESLCEIALDTLIETGGDYQSLIDVMEDGSILKSFGQEECEEVHSIATEMKR